MLFAGRCAVFPPLQRLSYLLPSTASDDIKLGEAQRVHDDFTSKAEELKPAGNKKVFRDGIQHRHMSVLCQPICGDSLCSCSEAEATGAERHQAEAARSAGGAEGSPAHTLPCRDGAAQAGPCAATSGHFQRRTSPLERQQAFLVEPEHRKWPVGLCVGLLRSPTRRQPR